jgi:hypothetical protein
VGWALGRESVLKLCDGLDCFSADWIKSNLAAARELVKK